MPLNGWKYYLTYTSKAAHVLWFLNPGKSLSNCRREWCLITLYSFHYSHFRFKLKTLCRGRSVELLSSIAFEGLVESNRETHLQENTQLNPPVVLNEVAIGPVPSPRGVLYKVIEDDGIFPDDGLLDVTLEGDEIVCDGATQSFVHVLDPGWRFIYSHTCFNVGWQFAESGTAGLTLTRGSMRADKDQNCIDNIVGSVYQFWEQLSTTGKTWNQCSSFGRPAVEHQISPATIGTDLYQAAH